MRIIIDSSAIIAASAALNSPAFHSIAASAGRIGVTICVPTVVIEEVVNHFREKVEEFRLKQQQAARGFSSLTGVDLVDVISEEMVEDQVAAYRKKLLGWVESVNGVVLNYPDVPHDLLALLDIRKVKPFGGHKSSYRDALIWFSILSLLEEDAAPVVFVSKNTRDFGESADQGTRVLHPDLVQHLEQRGLSGEVVQYLDSLDDFSRVFIEPQLEQINEIAAKLLAGTYPVLNLEQVLADRFDKLMEDLGVELDPGPLGFSEGANWISFAGSTGSYFIENVTARKLSDTELLIDFDAWIECEFELEAESRSELGWELDADDWPSTVYGVRAKEISVGMQLTFEVQKQELTSIRIRRLGEDQQVTSVTIVSNDNDIDSLGEQLAMALKRAPVRSYRAMYVD